MKEQIMQYITTAIASVGGIAGIITILCTIIKVFGGNSVKAKLANSKTELDKTMSGGLVDIERKIAERMNTQISVDISSVIADYVDKARKADRDVNIALTSQFNGLQVATSELLNAFAELQVLKAETKKTLSREAQSIMDKLVEVKAEVKPIATITLSEPKENAEEIANKNANAHFEEVAQNNNKNVKKQSIFDKNMANNAENNKNVKVVI